MQSKLTTLKLFVARLTPLFVMAVLFVAMVASAQESTVVDLTSEEAVAKLLLDSVVNKQWGLLASLVLTAVVWFSRKYVPEKTVVGAWLRTKAGGALSSLLFALGTGFVTQFLAGVPFGGAMVIKAISVALGASGIWSIVKNLRESAEESKAQVDGKAAETKPTDTLNQ